MAEYVRAPRVNRFVSPSVARPEPVKRVPFQIPVADELEKAIEQYATDPLNFVLNTFHWGMAGTVLAECLSPLEWQLEQLAAIGRLFQEDPRMVRVAISAGRGVGKTTLGAWCFLWHVACHPNSQTTIMSVTGMQSESRLWREIRKWRHVWAFADQFEIKARTFSHRDKDTWVGHLQMWNMDRLGAIRGLHEEYVCWIVDECSAIPDEVFAEIEQGLTGPHNFVLYLSNPVRQLGRFAACFGAQAERWHTVNVNAEDVPIVSRQSIQEVLEDCLGDRDADRYRVEVLGLFPKSERDTVIPQLFIDRACARLAGSPGEPVITPIAIGVDVASMGQNKTVFYVRQGRRTLEVQIFAKMELEDVAEKLMELMDKYYQFILGSYGWMDNMKERLRMFTKAGYTMHAFIDSDGIGQAVYQQCRRRGYPVVDVRSGSEAFEEYRYVNRRSELWLRDLRQWIRDEACFDATAPYFKTLSAQLVDIYSRPADRNRSQVETKKEMLARGVQSPDLADALVYSFFGVKQPQPRAITLRY
jgi:hypothetical protein